MLYSRQCTQAPACHLKISPKLVACLCSLTILSATGSIYAKSPRLATFSFQQDDKQSDEPPLKLAQPVIRTISGGQSQFYRLTLSPNQFAEVRIAQLGIDVAVVVFGPSGSQVIDSNSARLGESESVPIVSETSGVFRIEVRVPDKSAPAGRYEIRLKELRDATDKDRSHIAAAKLTSEALHLYRQQTAESRRSALRMYEDSRALWKGADDPANEAAALYMIATIHADLNESQDALEQCNQALALLRTADSKHTSEEQHQLFQKIEANILDTMGRVHSNSGDNKKAFDLFTQSLQLRHSAGDKPGEPSTLNYLAMSYGSFGEWRTALEYFKQIAVVLAEIGDRRNQAIALNNVSVVQSNLGQYRPAIDSCYQSLAISKSLGNRQGEAIALNSIGGAYSNVGEYQHALDAYNQSREIYGSLGDQLGEAIAIHNVAWVYATLGEKQEAIELYGQALRIFHTIGDKGREANSLSNLGNTYADLGDYKRALEIHLQVLPIRRAVTDPPGEAVTLSNIANCYSKLGQRDKALEHYRQALALQRSFGNRRELAATLRNIGEFYRASNDTRAAFDSFNEALQLSVDIGDKNGEAAARASLAMLDQDQGDLIKARTELEISLAAVESLRLNIRSQPLRATFFGSIRQYQEQYLKVLMRLHQQHPTEGFDVAAFQASEKGRARSLLELLAEAGAEIHRDVDPTLIEQERALREAISTKAERQIRLLSVRHNDDQTTAAAKDLNALTADYEQVQAKIRESSPRYAALTQPKPLTLNEIQTDVLDNETLLLEYSLGAEKSYLWAVTPTTFSSFELPPRNVIETSARRFYELLTSSNQTSAKETPEPKRKRLDTAATEYATVAHTLSQMLLAPVASLLKGKRLLIVGEGVLQYVPFAALPEPEPVTQTASEVIPLIVTHELVSLPSASVLAVLRRETSGRPSRNKTVAVIADPVFENSDPRIASGSRVASQRKAVIDSEVKRSASESGLADFVRLRFSRVEAEQIEQLAPASTRFAALDFAANRATATSSDLEQYRIVHFATHGLINNQHAELSGIVLSLVDKQGQTQNGFVRLYDIYNMKLKADLVVLSACQTALGREIKGEGLVGLTRAFMYAGAPRVVASLWRIDDRGTADLMTRFYKGMLVQNLRPAAALRAAQISMLKEPRWQAPRYWAAFTLQGEWR